MKAQKTFFTLIIAGLMVLLLCLPVIVFAGGGPNPCTNPAACDILVTHKVQGPSPNAFILAGWVPIENNNGFGRLEVFVWVGGRFYSGVWELEHPEDTFLGATIADIVFLDDDEDFWTLPESIAVDLYGKPA
ncbi:MAG: hypothetical protein PVI00_07985, partial [Desulfobacterales bacterium]